jgi:hypothetical protein
MNGAHLAYRSNNDGIIVMTWDDLVGYNDFQRISVS